MGGQWGYFCRIDGGSTDIVQTPVIFLHPDKYQHILLHNVIRHVQSIIPEIPLPDDAVHLTYLHDNKAKEIPSAEISERAIKKRYHAGLISTSFRARPLLQISEALPITSATTYFSPSTTPSGRQSG